MYYQHSFVPHTLIRTCVVSREGADPVLSYYEVSRKVEGGYELQVINPTTGEAVGGYKAVDGHPLVGLTLVDRACPIYKRWRKRRFAMLLEGGE